MRIWNLIDFGRDLSRPQRQATVIAKTPDDAMALAPDTCAMAFPIETRRPVWTYLA